MSVFPAGQEAIQQKYKMCGSGFLGTKKKMKGPGKSAKLNCAATFPRSTAYNFYQPYNRIDTTVISLHFNFISPGANHFKFNLSY